MLNWPILVAEDGLSPPPSGYFEQLWHVVASNQLSSRKYALGAHFGMDGDGAHSQI